MMNKILLVEDHEMNRDMLSRRLKRKGFEVAEAVDGLQALEKVEEVKPDLILMDMSLPQMDGWEATRRIKSNPETQDIPVIGLSAHAMSGDRQKGLNAGCDDYDTKPIDFKRLLDKIHTLLDQRSDS
ncbi:Response regulator [Sulfidibacter corallicola]|uniref:Response regulator n=2 Tax=Sulfidibacter corallicola TaxID=2818388 RepID=A0A8A4TGE6_SULCO|nr:response regulator [Sulfidibacter corallicola]QTD47798.1 response regulator [Sulfidibacter corallicola]